MPGRFLRDLLAPAHMCGDMRYWDSFQKADPPEPRKRLSRKEATAKTYLRTKAPSDRPVQTMDEARLAELAKWLDARIAAVGSGRLLVSDMQVDEYGDFVKVMELAQAGFLNSGRRLARIDYQLSDIDAEITLAAKGQRLSLRDMAVNKE